MEFDKLKLLFGEPYPVNKKITIYQPSIMNIIDFGEKNFYFMLNTLIANTTSYRLPLWEKGIDWNKITDFELFTMLVPNLSQESTALLFGDIDFQKFKMTYVKKENGEEIGVFINESQQIAIDEKTYIHIVSYLRDMFDMHPKVEKAKGKTTKLAIIEEDRTNRELHKKDEYQSVLMPLVSFCLNHPGFKYKKNELKEMGIVEFMDSVKRLQIYESTSALTHGIYSGMVDVSKIDKNEFNFLRQSGS